MSLRVCQLKHLNERVNFRCHATTRMQSARPRVQAAAVLRQRPPSVRRRLQLLFLTPRAPATKTVTFRKKKANRSRPRRKTRTLRWCPVPFATTMRSTAPTMLLEKKPSWSASPLKWTVGPSSCMPNASAVPSASRSSMPPSHSFDWTHTTTPRRRWHSLTLLVRRR